MRQVRIMGKLQFSQKVESKHDEYHNPDGQVYLPAHYSQVVGLVNGTQEFHSKCEYDKTQNNLN